MERFRVTIPRLLVAATISLLVGGCAGVAGVSPPTAALLALGALLVAGGAACTDLQNNPWTVQSEVDVSDAEEDLDGAEGTWRTCCENGQISSCYCPPNVACNYGRFKRCGGNRCVTGIYATCPGDAGDAGDTTPSDASDTVDAAEGTWQTCCKDGRISTCFCPEGQICNYGMFTRCGGDRCVYGPKSQCPGDAGDL